jgi:hypothetical protein
MPVLLTNLCRGCGDMVQHVTPLNGRNYCDICLGEVQRRCVACGAAVHRDDAIIRASDGQPYCSICARALFSNCHDCGRQTPLTRARPYEDGVICSTCFNRDYDECYYCRRVITRNERWSTPDEHTACESCYNDRCGVCDHCGAGRWSDDIITTSHGRLCATCNRELGEWEAGEFVVNNPTYDDIGSTRKFGIELETARCNNYLTLRGNTIWECKTDCSIEGREFVSPILYGDEGLNEIRNFCAIARRLHWTVNRYCGYHAHFDVSHETWESLRSIAYAYRLTYDLWCRLVSDGRAQNAYCGSPDYSLDDIQTINSMSDWEYFVGARDRFEFVNWRAYLVHGSCELRSHDASLNSAIICDWIKLHARFIDKVSPMSLTEIDNLFQGRVSNQFDSLTPLIGEALADVYASAAEEYGHPVRVRQLEPIAAPF